MDAQDETSAGETGERSAPLEDATRTSSDLSRVPSAARAGLAAEGIPATLGPYRILGKLGEGGMGVVFEAEQQHPRRRVALKVVRGGAFVDEDHLRMFQREADTLARLEHPNIGAIYESGRTPDGQRFFAMELVRGETLSVWLARRAAAVTASELELRLLLFRKIADAVHYAHQRGVIHRDLKPANIVVQERKTTGGQTASGVDVPDVKILDFGLARITDTDVAAATMTTTVGMIKGTLSYMSPEQARGNPAEIDIRADVYALGMILYEMLTRSRPYEVTQASLAEAVRVICEEHPRPLRQAWSGVRKLDPDVETIVGKALEKEAALRYASAAALSEDVGRYLAAQPILARPTSAWYQLRKFSRRHRAGVLAAAAVLVALVGGIVGTTWQAVRASRSAAAEHAQRVRAEASQLFALGQLALHGDGEDGLGNSTVTGPSVGLAYALASLERADDRRVREFVVEALWRGPTALIPPDGLPGNGAWSVDLSPDGRWLAAGYRAQQKIRLWSSGGGDATVLEGHEGRVEWVSFGPESDLLISAARDDTVRFYSIPDGAALHTLELDGLSLPPYLVSNPPRLITAKSTSGARRRVLWQSWSLDGRPLGELGTVDLSGVGRLGRDVDPGGTQLAFAVADELFVVPFDRLETARPRRIGSHGRPIVQVVFHPDGKHLVTDDDFPDHPARVWSLDPRITQPVREHVGAPYPIALRYDRDGSRLASTGTQGVFLWDLNGPPDSEPLQFRWATYGTHAADFHRDRPWLATGNLTGVSLWALTRRWASTYHLGVGSLAFGPDGSWLAARILDGKVWILPLSAAAGERPRIVLDSDPATRGLYEIAVDPRGRFVVASSETGGPWLVPLDGRQPRRLAGFESGARGLAIDRRGRLLAAHDEGKIHVRDLESGDTRVLDAGDGEKILNYLAFTHEGDLLSSGPGKLYRWDLEEEKRELLRKGQIIALYLSPDGRHVVTEPPQGVVTVHDLETGDSWDLTSHGGVGCVGFDPTGRLVVTGDGNGVVRVGPITGEEPHLLMGHEDYVHGVAVHPGGEWVASRDDRGELRLWPMPHGRPLHTLPREELVERLRSLTNLRVVADAEAGTDYRLDLDPFPGWGHEPTW